MRIDYPPHASTIPVDPVEIQAEHRAIIQAAHAVNASGRLGDSSELVFSIDRQTRRPVIRVVSRTTGELLRQIPDEQLLRMAAELKIPGADR